MKDFLYLNTSSESFGELRLKSNFNEKRTLVFILLFSALIVNLPWEDIRGNEFVDVENYIIRFSSNFDPYKLIEGGSFLNYITSEFLWAYFVISLKNLGFELELVFKFIAFCSASILTYFTVKNSREKLLISVLLINPLFIDFILSQMRNSFALAIILLGIMSNNKILKYALLVSATMIHSSSLILILIIFLLNRIDFDNKYSNILSLILIGITFAFALTIGKYYILDLLGDRRADQTEPQSSLLYGLFWMMFLLFILFVRKLNVQDSITKFGLVLLIIFSFSIFSGTYASRYLAIALPFLIISSSNLSKNNRVPSLIMLFTFQLVLFTYWIN